MSTTPEIAINIPLTASQLTACLQEPAQLGAQLTPAHKETINSFVFDQLTDKDGAPALTDFNVRNLSYNAETKKGRFRLTFQISRRFCCADVEACAADYLDFSFNYVAYSLQAKATYFQWNLDN